jgi:multidrug resistance efflux pump
MIVKLIGHSVTLAVAVAAGGLAWSQYQHYTVDPWTRDGQVRANVVGIAPRVSGPITRVAVRDNQPVRQGDLLFEIDPADFQAQVDLAAGQVQTAEANLKQQSQNLQRQTELYRTRVNALQDFQNAQDSFAATQAQLASAKANLDLAKLNLSYTKVFAPVDGYVTNMNTSPGTYVTAGNQLVALVDASSFWVAAYFKETQLPHIQLGQKARITLMGHAGQPFEGVVRSLGWGIFVADGSGSSSTALLPAVNQTIDWVRLPQRFPVRIQVERATPVDLRIGQTASVTIVHGPTSPEPADNSPRLSLSHR